MKKEKKKSGKKETSKAEENATSDMVELQRTRVICGPDINLYTSSSIANSQYQSVGVDSSFSLEKFKENLEIIVRKYDGDDMEFELRGVSCSVANALRRVMIAEVPTVAIEHVYIVNNTSIIQDEVLSHRLGLIPLAVDPRLLEWKGEHDEANERNTIILKLHVTCERLADGSMENDNVYSSQLTWLSGGSELPVETKTVFSKDQSEIFPGGVRPVHEDILIAKMRPGQTIELECHCIKGVGEEHAKWSPVATTWYKLYPEVVLLRKPPKDVLEKLVLELPGLLSISDAGEAVVDDAINHEKLLEKVRRLSGEEGFSDYIQLRKRKDRFIFTIESTGAYKPHEIFQEAIKRLESKCDKVLEGLANFPPP